MTSTSLLSVCGAPPPPPELPSMRFRISKDSSEFTSLRRSCQRCVTLCVCVFRSDYHQFAILLSQGKDMFLSHFEILLAKTIRPRDYQINKPLWSPPTDCIDVVIQEGISVREASQPVEISGITAMKSADNMTSSTKPPSPSYASIFLFNAA